MKWTSYYFLLIPFVYFGGWEHTVVFSVYYLDLETLLVRSEIQQECQELDLGDLDTR